MREQPDMREKPISLTQHAEARMKRGGISLDLVRMTLEAPDSTWIADYVSPTGDRRRISEKGFRTRRLRVVYADEEIAIVVFTAYWLKPKRGR